MPKVQSDNSSVAWEADDNVPADGSISTAKLANDAVTEAKIADSSVNVNQLKAGTGSAGQVLARNTANTGLDWVNQASTTIADGSITRAKLAADAVDNSKLADDAVDTENIADDAITASLIDDGAVGTSALANDAVTQAKIADGAVGSNQIASSSIGANKIVAGSITINQLASNSVGTSQIANGAVSSAKLQNGSVDISKINAGTGTANQVLARNSANNGLDWVTQSGGGSFTAATTAEIRAGTSNTKAMTPQGYKPLADEQLTFNQTLYGSFVAAGGGFGSSLSALAAQSSNWTLRSSSYVSTVQEGGDAPALDLYPGDNTSLPGSNQRFAIKVAGFGGYYMIVIDTSDNKVVYKLTNGAWVVAASTDSVFTSNALILPNHRLWRILTSTGTGGYTPLQPNEAGPTLIRKSSGTINQLVPSYGVSRFSGVRYTISSWSRSLLSATRLGRRTCGWLNHGSQAR